LKIKVSALLSYEIDKEKVLQKFKTAEEYKEFIKEGFREIILSEIGYTETNCNLEVNVKIK